MKQLIKGEAELLFIDIIEDNFSREDIKILLQLSKIGRDEVVRLIKLILQRGEI